jgi:hypothetical protein
MSPHGLSVLKNKKKNIRKSCDRRSTDSTALVKKKKEAHIVRPKKTKTYTTSNEQSAKNALACCASALLVPGVS